MTAPTPEEMARAQSATDADALSRFLRGPVEGAPPVEALASTAAHKTSSVMPPSDDPANVRRRRWGTAAAIESSPSQRERRQQQQEPTGGASWWQKTSWFAGANADVAPVLADPTGADGGTPSHGGIVAGAVQNRFTGPGQREPHAPVTPQSVRLWQNAAAVEDPGECHGGHNASNAGGAYRPVGGAMAHSRLSLQPRRVRGPTCADDFERDAQSEATGVEEGRHARDGRDRKRYEYDWSRGVWAVEGSGAVVVGARLAHDGANGADGDDADADDDEDVVKTEEVSEETLRIMEHTRGLRLDRFADAHDAATRKAKAKAEAKAGARADKAELKRAASAVPLAPRDGTLRHPSTAPPPPGGGEGDYAFHHETVRDDEEQWRMLRLRTGETVYFGAPDTLPETVAAWLDGTKPWPEIRAMELSIAARRALSVPPGAPGPVVCEALAEAAKAELRKVAEEDAAAAAEEEASKDGGVTGVTYKGGAAVKLAPGSTATPQQANIIERLVNATGASARASEDAVAYGRNGRNDWSLETLERALGDGDDRHDRYDRYDGDGVAATRTMSTDRMVPVVDACKEWGAGVRSSAVVEAMTPRDFFEGLAEPARVFGPDAAYRIDGWPSDAELRRRAPRHRARAIAALPFQEYTNPVDGPMNLRTAQSSARSDGSGSVRTRIGCGRREEVGGAGDAVSQRLRTSSVDTAEVLYVAANASDAAEGRDGSYLPDGGSYLPGGSCSDGVGTGDESPGAVWHVFRREHEGHIARYLSENLPVLAHPPDGDRRNHHHRPAGAETDDSANERALAARLPLHDGRCFLSSNEIDELGRESGGAVKPWVIRQARFEAVMVPAGCARQTRNLAGCVSLAVDFAAPESALAALRVGEAMRELPVKHAERTREGVQVHARTTVLHAAHAAVTRLEAGDEAAVTRR